MSKGINNLISTAVESTPAGMSFEGGLMVADILGSGIKEARRAKLQHVVDKATLNKTNKIADELHANGGDLAEGINSAASRKVNYENEY